MAIHMLDLRSAPSWDLVTLVPRARIAIAPRSYAGVLVALGDVVIALSPTRMGTVPASDVVTPQDVDTRTGQIAGAAARGGLNVFYVGTNGLQAGDVLVAPQPRVPALLIGEQHTGYSFSSRWVALRASEQMPMSPLVLWALLSCRTGIEARSSMSAGAMVPRVGRAELTSLLLPLPPLSESSAAVESTLRQIWLGTLDTARAEAARSWHGMADLLGNARWQDILRTHNTLGLAGGPSLRALGALVRAGSVSRGRLLTEQIADARPVMTTQALRRDSDADAWAVPRMGEVSGGGGDVVITSAGTRFRARLLPEPALVGTGLILVQQLQSPDAHRLAEYVNSARGHYALQQLVSGDYVPHLTTKALVELVLPPGSSPMEPDTGRESLAVALENALWPLIAS